MLITSKTIKTIITLIEFFKLKLSFILYRLNLGFREFLYFSIYERKNNGFIYNFGTYSNKGSEGLVEGSSDRRAAMEPTSSAKLINYHMTRGIYDFTMQTEAENFNQIAAMNLKAKAAGTVSKLDVLESLNIDEVEVAKNVNCHQNLNTNKIKEE